MELTILTPRVVVLGPLLPSAAGSQEGLHCNSCRQQQSHHLDDKPVVHHQLVFHHENSQGKHSHQAKGRQGWLRASIVITTTIIKSTKAQILKDLSTSLSPGKGTPRVAPCFCSCSRVRVKLFTSARYLAIALSSLGLGLGSCHL